MNRERLIAWSIMLLLAFNSPLSAAWQDAEAGQSAADEQPAEAASSPEGSPTEEADVAQAPVEAATATVGMVGRFKEFKLAGSELEVIPLEDRDTPIVLRIVRSFPHGSDFRYEMEYYGLEPGEYDLSEYLRRVDGSSVEDLPSIMVSITPELPPDAIRPNELVTRSAPQLGGYQQLLILGVVVWVAVLLLIIFWPKKQTGAANGKAAKPRSLAERLRPLVDRAVAGEASHTELASLERSLLTYWGKRLKLEGQSPAEMMRSLRAHDEAGGLIRQLETWLHHPEEKSDLDIEALLKPYRNVPEADIDLKGEEA